MDGDASRPPRLGSPSVLFVTISTERIAATRTRVHAFLPRLRAAGFSCTTFPAISDGASIEMLRSPSYQGMRKFLYYARIVFERLLRLPAILYLASRHDAVCCQRVTFPFGLSRVLSWVNPNIIFDFDDAIHLLDPAAQSAGLFTWLKERSRQREVFEILGLSKAAVVENNYLGAFARELCSDVRIVYGPIDTARYQVASPRESPETVIGWIGSPSTLPFLRLIEGPLKLLARSRKIRLVTIGGGRYEVPGVPSAWKDWRLEDEVSDLQAFDIGVMPMTDNEWTRGKMGHKMLQYMAVGIPAVVSYCPTLEEIVEDGTNAFFIRHEEEWVALLGRLIDDPALRRRVGAAGRATVESRCSVDVGASVWSGVLKRLTHNPSLEAGT